MEGVRENVNFRVGKIDEAPVHPDFFYFLERHRSLLIGGQRRTGNSGAPGEKLPEYRVRCFGKSMRQTGHSRRRNVPRRYAKTSNAIMTIR